MPPLMPDYRQQARKRMKRGLLPQVVAAAEAAQSSTGQLRTNTSGNVRSGKRFRNVTENGHDVHVYADGTRVGMGEQASPYAPGRRTGFGPGTGQGQTFPRPPDGAGQYQDQARRTAAPSPLGQGHGPQRPVEGHAQMNQQALNEALANAQIQVSPHPAKGPGQIIQTNYDKEAATLVALANAKRHQGVSEAPAGNHALLQRLSAMHGRKRRRGTGRITGGMLAS